MSEFLAGCLLGLLAATAIVWFFWRRRSRPPSPSSLALPDTKPDSPSPGQTRPEARARQWISAANHDLRQPLQAIKLLTMVLAQTEDPDRRREVADNLNEALGIMERMLDGLVDLARLEGREVVVEPTAMAAGGLMARLRTEFAPRAEAAGIALKIVGSSIVLRSDPRWLERIVAIFLENALTHGGATKIVLGCRRRGGELSIEVHDNGRGLSETELAEIFTPFHRQGAAASGGGLGVGLAIAQRASRLLGHRLDAASRPGHGSRFAIVVPSAGRPSSVQ